MDPSTLFLETQRLGPDWIFALVGGLTLLIVSVFGFGLYQQLGRGVSFGTRPLSDGGLVVVSLFAFALVVFVDCMVITHQSKLVTEVRADGVRISFDNVKRPPAPVFLPARSIISATPRDYDAVAEWGGWGFRRGAAGMAYTASGKRGVQVELADGRRVLIGSQAADDLAELLARSRDRAP